MKSLSTLLVAILIALAPGCAAVTATIQKADSYTEATPATVTVLLKNNSDRPLGLLSVKLAVGELRIPQDFCAYPRVAYDAEKGEARTAFVEGVEDIGPAAMMPLKYINEVGQSDAVIIPRILMPGDEITVDFNVTLYPKRGNKTAATAELIEIADCYKRATSTTTTQNVTRPDPGGNPAPFIETTITTYYQHMPKPLDPGEYLITKDAFDSNPRVTASASTTLNIVPLPFTLTDAETTARFSPDDFLYFHPGNIWLFYKDGVTTFVAKDTLESHPGNYILLAESLEKNGETAEVEIFDEIKDGSSPLLYSLADAGYTTFAQSRGGGAIGKWQPSKAMDSLSGPVTIKGGNLLQFARDLDKWGYRADGAQIRKSVE